ncbi:MAG: N-acetylgalactosamine-6-sulfatase, partial [Limisphaerales bacterium]
LGVHKRFLPLARGFDEFYGFVNTGIDYYTHERYGVPSMYRNNTPTTTDKGTYCTDLFEREAVRFLKSHHKKPFFLYLPFNAPHNASNLDPAIRAGAQGPESAKKLYPHLQADAGFTERKFGKYGEKLFQVPNRATKRLEYAASITSMDAAIGRVLELLDHYQVADNTLVIFLSDNGGGGASDNAPLRGGKGQMFEGGLRVPCIIRWPGRVPAGKTNDAFLTTLEILPTLLQASQVKPPQDVILDGFDLLPVLRGEKPSARHTMFWQRRLNKGARVGDWKWVNSNRGSGLFNLRTDVGEQQDLSVTHPNKLEELKQHFARWKKQMDAAEPRGPFRDF